MSVLADYTDGLLGNDRRDDPAGGPHPREHRQWYETHGAIIVLLILAILFGAAATGLSAGYGSEILAKLKDCCGDIKEQLTAISEQITDLAEQLAECCSGLSDLIQALWDQLTLWFNSVFSYFSVVISKEDTIISILQNTSTRPFVCSSSGSFSLPPDNCTVLTAAMLPLTVTQRGACYVMQSDLAWTSSSFAVTWSAGRGSLFGCGFRFIANGTSPRILNVIGRTSSVELGELTAYDVKIESPTPQYHNTARGLAAQDGAILNVYDVMCINMFRCIQVIASTLTVIGANVSRVDNITDPVRIANVQSGVYTTANYAVFARASVVTIDRLNYYGGYVGFPNGTGDYSIVSPAFGPGLPAWSNGIYADYFVPGSGQTSGSLIVRNSRFDCTDAMNVYGAAHVDISNVFFRAAVSLPPANPAYPLLSNGYGILLSTGPTSKGLGGSVRDVTIDLSANNEYSRDQYGLYVEGASGVNYERIQVFGNQLPSAIPRPSTAAGPGTIGLVTVATNLYGYSQAAPVQFKQLTVRALSPESVGVVIGNSGYNAFTPPGECHRYTGSVVFDESAFYGTAAAIVVGSEQRHGVVVRNSAFFDNYYGVFTFNNSANVAVRDSQFVRNCEAVHASAATENMILRNNEFMGNNFDLVDDSAAVIDVGPINAGTLYMPCDAPAPEFWDLALTMPDCPIIAGVSALPNRALIGEIDE